MSTLPTNTIAYRSSDLLVQIRRPKGPFTKEAMLKFVEDHKTPTLLAEDVPKLITASGVYAAYVWVWHHLASSWPLDYNAWGDWSIEYILAALHDVLHPDEDPQMPAQLRALFDQLSLTSGARLFESDERRQGSFMHTNAAEVLSLLAAGDLEEDALARLGYSAQGTELIFIFNRFLSRGEAGRKPMERVMLDLCGHWFMNDKPRADWRNTWRKA